MGMTRSNLEMTKIPSNLFYIRSILIASMAESVLIPPLDYDHVGHAVFWTDQHKVAMAHGAPKWFKAAILHDNFP